MERGPKEPSDISDYMRQGLPEKSNANGEETSANIIPMHYPLRRVCGLVYKEIINNPRTPIELTDRHLSSDEARRINSIVDRARIAGDNELSYYAWYYLQNIVTSNGDLNEALGEMEDFINKFKTPKEYT